MISGKADGLIIWEKQRKAEKAGGTKMDKQLPSVMEMIKTACEYTGLDFDRLWFGENAQSISLCSTMTDEQNQKANFHPETKKIGKAQWELISIIFQKYMDSYPANAVFKQKLYEDLMKCLQFIVGAYELVPSDKLKNALETPVKEDPTAAFLKTLHNQLLILVKQTIKIKPMNWLLKYGKL